MLGESIDFDAPDLASQLEKLSPAEIDALSFGVIRLDRDHQVVVYSKTEAQQSGFGRQPIGEAFFPLTRWRFDTDEFRGRIERAMADGKVDLEFGWKGDYEDRQRDVHIRVQSSADGGIWLCIERDAKH